MKSGFILIDKNEGPTSFGVIYKLRKVTGIKKIGHAGTLDPFASGLLVVAVGREATKRISQYVKLDKEYEAVLRLGETSTTFDVEGEIKPTIKSEESTITIDKINEVLDGFLGEQEQVPPMFSAKKIGGRKLCDLARKGIEIERVPSIINIHSIEILEYKWPELKIKVACSTGTYIRALGHDIGQVLGCGAYLTQLRRIKVGDFDVKDSVLLDDLDEDTWCESLLA